MSFFIVFQCLLPKISSSAFPYPYNYQASLSCTLNLYISLKTTAALTAVELITHNTAELVGIIPESLVIFIIRVKLVVDLGVANTCWSAAIGTIYTRPVAIQRGSRGDGRRDTYGGLAEEGMISRKRFALTNVAHGSMGEVLTLASDGKPLLEEREGLCREAK